MEKITFAERLKEARKNAKLTQQQLADIVGRTKSAVSRWESGENTPQLFDLVKIENAVGVSGKVLMYGTDKIEPTTLAEINTVSSQLEEERQKVVLNTANSQLKEQKAVKREKQMLPFKKMQLDKINNLVPYDHDQEGFAPVIGEIAAGTPIFSEQNFEGMRPVYGKYAGRDDVFWLHVKGDSMESEIHDGSFALILLSPDIDDGAIGAVRFTDDNSATLKCVHYEYDDAGYIKRIRLEPLNPKYPIQYADESNPAEIAGRLVKVEQDY